MPADVAAARDAGSPVGLTVSFAAFHWVFGPALSATYAAAALLKLRDIDRPQIADARCWSACTRQAFVAYPTPAR